jgi:hypothetical protein
MTNRKSNWKYATGLGIAAMLLSVPLAPAQDRDRDYRDRDNRDHPAITTLTPGTTIPIRLNEPIDVERRDNRVYIGRVDREVRGDNGRLGIPAGSQAELIVRVARDNDLILDLESVTVNGVRYAIRTDTTRVESQRDNSLVGAIVGAVSGGEVRGRAVRIPRDAVVTFRLDRPLDMNVADRGVTRNGYHYHDWYDHDRDRDRQ